MKKTEIRNSLVAPTRAFWHKCAKKPKVRSQNSKFVDKKRRAARLRRYDMNGIFQMQEGKNWFLPK
jgi:hypothetical protein